ncbi:hypothetical protein COLO4_34432 [Corchorus olitorius]|uniref:Uncharacterized protein n=1 Tax=Corchorus olitorius TaxID=93759 RepID=A0A1R3GKS6_9ROSI|nr:hypothetical protein COLO4_34432 [Corchorus olitorius]
MAPESQIEDEILRVVRLKNSRNLSFFLLASINQGGCFCHGSKLFLSAANRHERQTAPKAKKSSKQSLLTTNPKRSHGSPDQSTICNRIICKD